MNCKEVNKQASNYIDGDLPLLKRIGIAIHIFICTPCRTYLKQLRSTAAAIATIKPKEKTTMDTQDVVNNLIEKQKEMESEQ